MATRDPPRQPGGGLALVPLEAGQIEAALAIRRDYFAAHPAFCWFAADPGSVAHLRRKLAAPRPRDRHLAVVAGERVVGCASVFVFDPDPHHGRSGGLDIVLHPDIQGRGVGTVIYRVLLEYLEAEGIGWVKGTTGQPSVMHLARLMGRQPTSVMLRRSPVLPSAWFDEVLP